MMKEMRSRLLLAFALSAPLLSGCGGGGIADFVDSITDSSGSGNPNGAGVGAMSAGEKSDADEVLRLVNVERAKAQLPPVVLDLLAERAAYDHSVDMDVRQYFDHYAPAPLNTDPGQRLDAAGAVYLGWGENIAEGQISPAEVMADWMNSQGHRDNILNGAFTHLGVGVRYGTGAVYWTQDFLVALPR